MNRIMIIALITLVSSLMTVIFAFTSIRVANNADRPSIVVDTELPQTPEKLTILKIEPFSVTEQDISLIASELFDLNGEISYSDGVWKVVDEAHERELLIYDSGFIRFFDRYKLRTSMIEESKIMDKEELLEKANEFIMKLNSLGLMPMNVTIGLSSEDSIVNDMISIMYRNGTTRSYVNNVHVNYKLYYEGLELYGPGAKFRIYFDDKGNVIGFLGVFFRVKEYKELTILSPMDAVNKLYDVGFGRSMPINLVDRAVVKSIKLVYFVPTPSVNTTYIIPAYIIKGELIGKNGEKQEFIQIVWAVSMDELKHF